MLPHRGAASAFATALACIVLIVGCGEAGEPSDGNRDAGGAEPASRTFSSERGYSLTVPAEWQVQEATGTLPKGEVPGPGDPRTDHFVGQGGQTLLVGVQPVGGDDSIRSYAEGFAQRLSAKFPPCGQPKRRQARELDEVPAVLLEFHCTDGYLALNLLALHERRAFIIAQVTPSGTEQADRKRFEDITDSFRFE